MKVSLISPLFKESSLFAPHLQDIKSFFSRFPIDIELIVAIPEQDSETLKDISTEEQTEKFSFKIVKVKSNDRAKAIFAGLEAATGDILLTFSWDLTIPLAEFFNFIQELFQNPTINVVLGNRFDAKKKNSYVRSSWHKTLNQIITEKLRRQGWALSDPLTPFVAIRKFDKALLNQLHLSGWYYTPSIINWAHSLNWQIEEVSVVSRPSTNHQKTSRIPLFREFLRHLL